MKIKIHTAYDGIVTVNAKKIKSKRQGKLKFYIYKSYKSNQKNKYSISESISGLAVCQETSKKGCKEILEDRLRRYSKTEWIQSIKKIIKQNNIPAPLNK